MRKKSTRDIGLTLTWGRIYCKSGTSTVVVVELFGHIGEVRLPKCVTVDTSTQNYSQPSCIKQKNNSLKLLIAVVHRWAIYINFRRSYMIRHCVDIRTITLVSSHKYVASILIFLHIARYYPYILQGERYLGRHERWSTTTKWDRKLKWIEGMYEMAEMFEIVVSIRSTIHAHHNSVQCRLGVEQERCIHTKFRQLSESLELCDTRLSNIAISRQLTTSGDITKKTKNRRTSPKLYAAEKSQ